MRSKPSWLWWALAAAVSVWLLWMTLRPNQAVATNLAPLTTSAAKQGISARLLIDLAGNVVVFVPLGAPLALALRDRPAGHRLLLATLGGAGLSLVIELVQTTVPTRVAALGDWLLNAVGTGVGAVAASWMSYIFAHNERPATNDE
jgi:glycopeptide antibiotics resistance protein